MNRRYLHIFIFLILLGGLASTAQAQLVRYVKSDGKYTNAGMSWDDAKNNLQDAINELHNYMQQQGISEGGCIYVAEGTYVPTESTEQSGGGVLFTAFKMYAGINVYGGYVGNETGDALLPENRELKDGATKPWEMKHETILSGNHSTTDTKFQWNPTKQTYDTSFPGNSYHVVWFATEGWQDNDRAKPLSGTSILDGFTIEGGSASNRSLDAKRQHNAFGGGVYMVSGAHVKNCIIRKNEASRRGGGIYLDGGGEVDFCYFHQNQCLGIGIVAGYGGGVCIESDGLVQHSVLHNNTARVGGGATISAEGVEGTACFNPTMKGCVISNNTSTTEAGGLFLYKGGQVNHMTVVRNKCTGPNVVIQGRRYGRSAGIYLDKTGIVTNTVMWGGEVEANSNAQYAAHTQESTDKYKPYLNYSAISNHDFADWTATSKLEVMAIGSVNEGASGHYPNFGKGADGVEIEDIPAGVEDPGNAVLTPETRWVPLGFSPLRAAGVRQADFITSELMLPSSISYDMDGTKFLPRTTIGAYASLLPKYVPVLMASLEDGSKKAYTFFLDPNRSKIDLSEAEYIGHSWEQPMGKINDVFRWWNEHKGKTIRYFDGPDATVPVEAPLPDDATVQILVKAGTCSTAGNYFSDAMRSGYIQLRNNSHLFGGFPEAATGRSIEGRDPVKNQTTISANIINNGYHFNSARIISFGAASNAVVDGFRLAYAYSLPNKELNESVGPESPIYYEPLLRDGGAILIQDKVGPVGSMTGNKVRNCVMANCTSERGAAIFVQSSRADVEIGVEFENCIIHNNTSTFDNPGMTPSAVYVESSAGAPVNVRFNHCNFTKNACYGLHLTGSTVNVTMDNSVVWANATKEFAHTEDLADAVNRTYIAPIRIEGGATLSGTHNLLDDGVTIPAGLAETQAILTYHRTEAADGTNTFPIFVNATKNIGASDEGDLTEYGGVVNFMPRNLNPMVNAAAAIGGTDLTTNVTRDYGGAADIGAIENYEKDDNGFQPKYGKVIYVRDYGFGSENNPGGDGSSWATAINGNCTTYVNDHGFKGVDAELYPEGTALTGLQWAVDHAFYLSLEKEADGKTIKTHTATAYSGADLYSAGTGTTQELTTITLSTVDPSRTVEVWVGAGEYLRRDGFFMRNSVQVYGGFPGKGNPGMADRNPRETDNNTIIETNTNKEISNNTFEWGPKMQDFDRRGEQTIFGKFNPIDKKGWQVVAYSSEETTGEDSGKQGFARFVIDGDDETYWHSNWKLTNPDMPHWMVIDMVSEQDFRFMRFLQSQIGGERTMRNLKVEISTAKNYSSNDNRMNWSTVYNSSTPRQLQFDLDLGKTYTARFFRITIFRNGTTEAEEPRYKRINEIYLFKSESDMGGVPGVYDLNNYKTAYYTRRVLTQPFPYYRGTKVAGSNTDLTYNMEIINEGINAFDVMTSWDGFTIRNGRVQLAHSRDGGAGVALRHNGRIINCVVENNQNRTYNRLRGGGIFCNGGEIANCIVRGNILSNPGSYTESDTDLFGGGLYLRLGKVYNTCFAENEVKFEVNTTANTGECEEGGAVFFENGEFYNNTITGNTACHALRTGNWFDNGQLHLYNTLVYGNHNKSTDGLAFSIKVKEDGTTGVMLVAKNCLFESESSVQKGLTGSLDYASFRYQTENPLNDDYTLKETSLAINAGTTDLNGIVLPDFDAEYADRIQDCQVDIGAYEFNGSYSITPTTSTADGKTTATFYVTGPGRGLSSAADVDNAACQEKLQKVLDAAGRYKFAHPKEQVIVKLATIAGGGYAPSRSSVTEFLDQERENPRTFSLMVPRGIEVWGGYDDDFETRDVINNKTVLTGGYTSDGQNVNCYHVVTFTDDLFDENGEKLVEFNGIANPTLNPDLSTAAVKLDPLTDRAILDGLFIEEGDASGEIIVPGDNQREQNVNRYGGAAIVTNFAHVRNCILTNNNAAYGGGALMLEEGALVSGCVFENNSAQRGGAVYVKQNQDKDFDPREWDNIRSFAHIYSSTIVKNSASDAGGGIWFNNNVRVNSTVLWNNSSNNSANVCGQIDPYSTSADTKTSVYYPFMHSAIENLRVPGMNNISVNTDETKGVRFDPTVDPYYYLRYYSVLARAGMEVGSYEEQFMPKASDDIQDFYYPTLETVDLAGNSRVTYNRDAKGNTITAVRKDFIEIGARAFNGPLIVTPTATDLITRLYVTTPENINDAVFSAMSNSGNYIQGSSFAYPMQKLDDALYYIQYARKNLGNTLVTVRDPEAIGKAEGTNRCCVRNIRFEIFVGSGTYYPYRTVSGSYDYSRSNTFLVPEGVSIYGGLYVGAEDNVYYAQHLVDGTADRADETLTLDGQTFTLKYTNTSEILRGRELEDLNQNSIKEPWEMKHQTILSGKSVNSEVADNVYHVITCIADESSVGTLPDAIGTVNDNPSDKEYGSMGATVVLDGLQIMDGKAVGFDASAVTNAYSFYRGGGVLVDGNWLNDERTETGELKPEHPNYSRAMNPRSVGRRCIPLAVRNCEFLNNRAGGGGAIYSNGYLELYSCNFAQNAAKRRDEQDAPADARHSFGNGGAVFSSYILSAVNTIFANNEAGVVEETADISLLDPTWGSRGGAVFHAADDTYGYMSLINCDIVNNSALSYPAIYTLYPNRGGTNAAENPHKVVNSIFWGNATVPAATIEGGAKQLDFTVNYWNRLTNTMVQSPAEFSSVQKDGAGNPALGEMLWFCAYEQDHGCEPRFDDRHEIDYRTANYTDGNLNRYIPDVFADITYHTRNESTGKMEEIRVPDNTAYRWVTNNLYLSSDNNALDGPNFVNPSLGAGVNNYLPSADWMVSRQNNLTDNGWTRIEQEVQANNPDDPTDYTCEFIHTDGETLPANAHGIYADTRRTYEQHDYYYIKMPLGEERYMQRVNGDNLYRISKDPNPSQYQTFIDLGVYEYQHTLLQPEIGDEVDILWVSTEEKPANGPADGSSWLQPTSDLQRAIETLLASRNNHHKKINVIEGQYTPIYTIDGYMSFTVNTGSLNAAATLPTDKHGLGPGDFGVKSLTIEGGWSKDVDNLHDIEAYPSVLEMATRTGVSAEKMATVLRISDALNWYGTGKDASPVPASGSDELQRVIPVTIEGITMQNVHGYSDKDEGVALCYEPQYCLALTDRKPTLLDDGSYVLQKVNGEHVLVDAPADGRPKLSVDNSIVRLNGADGAIPAMTAVTIGEGGGYSIVCNTLFHSNLGASMKAYNTRVVNCTFALNGGPLTLLNDKAALTQPAGSTPVLHSLLMNSLLWRNSNPVKGTWEMALPAYGTDYLNNNAIFGKVCAGDYTINEDDGTITIAGNTTNRTLSESNSDVLTGPNFVEPLVEAVTRDDYIRRDFHLRPSARTIDQGEDDLYIRWARNKTVMTDEEHEAERDLAYMPRFKSLHIDRGAYEYQGELQRVIYVDPTRMVSGSGTNWGSPYGFGQLQSAIDLAAVFHIINEHRAYVFCKGGQATGEVLTPRPGVNVYAGIPGNYTRIAALEPADDGNNKDGGYDEEDLHDYIVYVLGDRTGVAAPNADRTGVNGIHTTGVYPSYALMDGFDIAPAVPEVTTPVVDFGRDVQVLPVVLRNSIVHDVHNVSDVTDNGAAAVVRVCGGLLYNVLVRDCDAAADNIAATYIGDHARAVGCTFLGKGATGYAIRMPEGTSPYRVAHSITWNPDRTEGDRLGRLIMGGVDGFTNCNNEADGYPFATYLQPAAADNHPARPVHHTAYRDLWYQLEENSRQLDYSGRDFTPELYSDIETALGMPAADFPDVMDFSVDRDLLGNPRLPKYHPAIDRGCFEAWNVPAGQVASATYYYDDAIRGANRGGRRHPQEGSVIYLHENASLVMSADDFDPTSTTALGRNEVLHPGYLLLCEGASLYGEGTAISLGHVGVERRITAEAGALVALPYAFDYTHARLIAYDATGHVQQTVPDAATEVYYYDGAERAGWNYAAVETNSTCWKPVATSLQTACSGVWYHPTADGTYRFTAADPTAGATLPVYREGFYDNAVEEHKNVTLTQYDYRTMNGQQPNFTIVENMGWNLVGSPYLVSNYNTCPADGADGFSPDDYPMTLPRFVYTANADGQFAPNPSWTAMPGGLSPAVAFFTQTATQQTTETLTFRRPHYDGADLVEAAPRKILTLTDAAGRTDAVTLLPDVEVNELPAFRHGQDGLQWSPLVADMPQVYVPFASGTRLDWLSSVPVATDIPLGITLTGGAGCTIALPEAEAWAEYSHIWLTDHLTGDVTDLKAGDYIFDLPVTEATAGDDEAATSSIDHRFTLRIGGIRPDGGADRDSHRYRVYAENGNVVVTNLMGGENVEVFDVAGRSITSTIADSATWRTPLTTAVYVVRVNHEAYKVRVR